MDKYVLWGCLLLLLSCTGSNTYRRQVSSLPPHCQKLLRELKYRIITNDTGGYTFRFEYPVSDTIPKSETLRGLEYLHFNKTVLNNDTLCQCGFTHDIITKTIGKENRFYNEGGKGNTNKIAKYILDFGFNCDGNRCPGTIANECNSFRFIYNLDGILVKCSGSIQTFDIEPYYCTANARAYLERMEREQKQKK